MELAEPDQLENVTNAMEYYLLDCLQELKNVYVHRVVYTDAGDGQGARLWGYLHGDDNDTYPLSQRVPVICATPDTRLGDYYRVVGRRDHISTAHHSNAVTSPYLMAIADLEKLNEDYLKVLNEVPELPPVFQKTQTDRDLQN